MKKFILTFLLIALLCALCACNEQQQPEAPACDELGHEMAYTSNSSVHVYKCTREGCTYAEAPKAHRGGSATCTAPGICTDCGMEYQKKTEHIFAGATCSKPGNCTVCNAEGGEQPPHTFAGATCTELAKCTVCGATGGELLPHNYIGATCIAQGSCTACGAVGGELAPDTHVIPSIGEPCTLCGEDYYNATLKFELMADGNSYAVTGIGSCKATELIIPAEHRGKPVTAIASNAFVDNEQIRSVHIPGSVERIESDAFCATGLEEITMEFGVKYIGHLSFGYTQITDIRIPGSIERIEPAAMGFCENLKSVYFEDGIKRISEKIFSECPKLKEVRIPNSIESVDEHSFLDCAQLQYTFIDGFGYLGNETNPVLVLAKCYPSENITKIEPPEGTKVIFDNLTSFMLDIIDNVKSVRLPSTLKFIPDGAIVGLKNVTSIEVSEDNPKYYLSGDCIIDREKKSLAAVFSTSVIPNDGSVEYVDTYLFSAIFEQIIIPEGVKHVRIGFYDVKSLVIGPDVETITLANNRMSEEVDELMVYVYHTQRSWEKINVIKEEGWDEFQSDSFTKDSEIYYYSETEPTAYGKFWHYVNGVPTPW